MLESIIKMHHEMKELTIKSGVNPDDYNILAKEVNETTNLQILEEVYTFLKDVSQDWEKVKYIYNLLTPDVWLMLEKYADQSLVSLKLLKEACIPVRKKWRSFIKIWKKRVPA